MDYQIFQAPVDKKISLQKDYDPSLISHDIDKEKAAIKLKSGIARLS